jgi:hypothetical protein
MTIAVLYCGIVGVIGLARVSLPLNAPGQPRAIDCPYKNVTIEIGLLYQHRGGWHPPDNDPQQVTI